MKQRLRELLEQYPGITPPMSVQTDLSNPQVPSYAVTQRRQETAWEDVRGRRMYTGEFVFYLRGVAVGEGDRRGADHFLRQLGRWLEEAGPALAGVETIRAGLPSLQEAYDDGTAAWSMNIRLDWLE